MIQEARKLPPQMLVVAGLFVVGFLIVSVGTVVAVVASAGPTTPAITDIGLPRGVAVVDRQSSCSPDVCDGEVGVVESPGMGAPATLEMIRGRLLNAGWSEQPCAGRSGTCFAQDDIRVEVAVWSDRPADPITAVMRTHFVDRGVDERGFVFVDVHRCGPLVPCD